MSAPGLPLAQGAAAVWRLDGLLFAAALGLLGLVWLGYPLLVAVWSRLRPYAGPCLDPAAPDAAWPRLSVIIAAHNEAAHIEERLRNLWSQDYPAGQVEILVSEDGSSDDTAARVAALAAARPGAAGGVRLLSLPRRLGKAGALNRAAALATGEVLVFTDANNLFLPATLRRLAAPFTDPSVGAVTGCKAVAHDAGLGGGEGVYYRYEAWLNRAESRTGSGVAAFGEALAVRRACFRPIPTTAMVNDDLFLALQVLLQGRRLLAAPEARSWELGAAGASAEWERRRRMMVGRWSALATLRGHWRELGPAHRLRVLCHEVLRPVSALAVAVALLSGLGVLLAPAAALPSWVRAAAWLQAAAYALVGMVAVGRWRGFRLGRLEAVFFFCLAQAAALAGWWRYLRGNQPPLWQRAARAAALPAGPPPRSTAPAARSKLAPPPVNNSQILSSLFWASSAFVLGKVLVFGSVVILARLLAPQAFGEVALALSAVLVLEILGNWGLPSTLIFEDHAVEAAATICFWITLATALAEVAAGWPFAPVIARFFHEPGLTPMLRVLGLYLVSNALGNTHDTLLRRRLAFRRKLVPDLGMAAAKGGAGIALALAGFGAWSLVWGQVLGSVAGTIILWWITPWRPAWPWAKISSGGWDPAVFRRMLAYSKHIYALDASSVLLSNFDSLTIGRMLSDTVLGFYTLAFRIPEVLLLSVLNVITRVVFPAFSRLQNDAAALRAALLDTARYTTLLTLPMAAGVALLAREIVFGLYGWHWGPSVPVLRVLALYAGLRCLAHHFGDAYKAIGRPDILTRITGAWWLLLPPALILGAHWGGIVGVAWGQIATRVAMTGLHLYLIAHVLEVHPRDLWRCYAPALEGTAVMSLAVLLLHPFFHSWGPRPTLALLGLGGAAIYAGYLHWRYPQLSRNVRAQLRPRRFRPRGSGAAPLPVALPEPFAADTAGALGPRA